MFESEESLHSTQPIPPKHLTIAAIRAAMSNFEDKWNDKAPTETSGHRHKKKKKTKKQTFEVSPKKVKKESMVTFDDKGNAE